MVRVWILPLEAPSVQCSIIGLPSRSRAEKDKRLEEQNKTLHKFHVQTCLESQLYSSGVFVKACRYVCFWCWCSFKLLLVILQSLTILTKKFANTMCEKKYRIQYIPYSTLLSSQRKKCKTKTTSTTERRNVYLKQSIDFLYQIFSVWIGQISLTTQC